MEKFIVSKAIFDSRGTPLYMPVGYVEGLAECIEFNRNNVTNGFIALYSSVDNSMGITSYKMSTETITEDPTYFGASGRFFDTIRNTRDTPLDFCGQTIPPHGQITFFWNYKIAVLCHQELENNYRNGLVVFVDRSGVEEYVLGETESLQRLNAIKTRAWSQRVYNEEDRLLWNIFVGQMILVKFREYNIGLGITNPSIGMQIQNKLSLPNTMIQNGQLIEAKFLLSMYETDQYITPQTIARFISYIDSCYVFNVESVTP